MRKAFLYLSSGKKGFSFPQFCITEVYLSLALDYKGFSFPWLRIRKASLFLSSG
jgi:hypothetical protein